MLNRAQIIGRLGRDPEVRYLPSGEAVCNFSVATTEKWRDKNTNDPKEETLWHRVTAFGRQAEIVGEYLRSGSLVFIEGKMTQRKYEKGGVEHISYEIRMADMKMLGGRSDKGGEAGGPNTSEPARQQSTPPARPLVRQAPPPGGSGFDDMDDDIPF